MKGIGRPHGLGSGLVGLEERLRKEERSRKEPPMGQGLPVRRRGPGRRAPVDELEEYAAQTYGSKAERIFERWCQRNGFQYEREVSALGGDVLGGARLDFVVYGMLPGGALVVRVMGTWVHRERGLMDAHQLVRLLESGYRVVDLWDLDLYQAVKQKQLDSYIWGQVLGQVGGLGDATAI